MMTNYLSVCAVFSFQKEGRQRGTWNTKKADGDFYKMIVGSILFIPPVV